MLTLALLTALPPLVLSSWEHGVIAATNQQRVEHGQWPLLADPALMQSARRHARWMAANGCRHSGAAENIARDYVLPDDVVWAWMASESHRRNVLDPRWRRVGVGMADSESGQRFWVQQFGE